MNGRIAGREIAASRQVRPEGGRESIEMVIETSRFGGIEVDSQRFLNFPRGLLGFPEDTDFALIQTGENSAFYWMQSVKRPDLAFVVCDPRMFIKDYKLSIKPEDLSSLGLVDADGSQVFVIVNKVKDGLTGNLQGPLVINVATRQGKQLVLSDKRFSTRYPLMQIPNRQEAVARTA